MQGLRVLAAPDSFKESMGAAQACTAIAEGVHRVWPKASVRACPMADGGEGTLDAVLAGGSFVARNVQVDDALGRPKAARFGWDESRKLALIEAAEACGLEHIAPQDRDIWRASSYGVGQLISDCLSLSPAQICLTLGGSATNDAGMGMLAALGAKFYAGDQVVDPTPISLTQVDRVDLSGMDPRLTIPAFEVAVDVNNPLLGPNGATYVFGPQKGACADDLARLDATLAHVSALVEDGHAETKGAGAAGGLGWASLQFLGATPRRGVDLVADLTGLAASLKDADLVITGEGRVDAQTLSGKTAHGIAQLAKAAGVPVVLLAGSVSDGANPLLNEGVNALLSIMRTPATVAEALEAGPKNLAAAAEAACRLIALGKSLGNEQ